MTSYYINPFPTFRSYVTDNTFSGLEKVLLELEETMFNRKDCSYPYDVKVLKDGTCILEYSLAGFTKDEVTLKVEQNKLIVKAKLKKKEEEEGVHYVHAGIAKRSMVHTVPVDPNYHDLNNIKADFENGILVVTIPQTKESKESNFEVKIN